MQGRFNLRQSAAIRVAVAVAVSAALTAIAIAVLWHPLDLKTDIVGYPVFANFNVQNFFNAYYLVIAYFPGTALLLFLGLIHLAPRIGLPVAPPRGPLRPAGRGGGEAAKRALDPDPPLRSLSAGRMRVQGRWIGLVGALLAGGGDRHQLRPRRDHPRLA